MAFYSEIGTHLFILCFSLYQTVLKKHTKIKKRRLLLVRRYLGFTFFFVFYLYPSSSVSLNFPFQRAQAGDVVQKIHALAVKCVRAGRDCVASLLNSRTLT